MVVVEEVEQGSATVCAEPHVLTVTSVIQVAWPPAGLPSSMT